MVIYERNLWETQSPIDYNPTILELAIKNKEIAEKRKNYNEIDKWGKVIILQSLKKFDKTKRKVM